MRRFKHRNTGDIAVMKSNNSSFYTYDGMDIHARIVENSTDWQEIKEPLFITEDGIEIYDNTDVAWVIYGRSGWKYEYNLHFCIDHIKLIDHNRASFKIFSTREAAEKWIDEDKPMFSKKQIRDFVKNKSWMDSKDMKEFKEKFGL